VADRQNTKNKRNLKNTSYVLHYLSYDEKNGEAFSNLLQKFVIALYHHISQIKKDCMESVVCTWK
jgi:hypothetical protein